MVTKAEKEIYEQTEYAWFEWGRTKTMGKIVTKKVK